MNMISCPKRTDLTWLMFALLGSDHFSYLCLILILSPLSPYLFPFLHSPAPFSLQAPLSSWKATWGNADFGIRNPWIWHSALLLSSGMAQPPFSEDIGFHSVTQQSTKYNTPWNIHSFMHSTGIYWEPSMFVLNVEDRALPKLTKILTLCILNSSWRKIIRKQMKK